MRRGGDNWSEASSDASYEEGGTTRWHVRFVIEYCDWGGRGFDRRDGGLWAIAGTKPGAGTRMVSHRWEAPRRRGDALLFSRRSSSTENSVVVTTLYSFNINLANSSPPAGLCNCDQCVLSTPEPGVKSADA